MSHVNLVVVVASKNTQAQLAQHGFRLDAEHGSELPQALPAEVLGLAFEDFDHSAVGLQRGSAQVQRYGNSTRQL